MKKYEYMTVDLSAEPSFNVHIKLERYIEELMTGSIRSLSEKLMMKNNRQEAYNL